MNDRQDSRARWAAAAPGWEAVADDMRRATIPVSSWMVEAIRPQPGHTVVELAAGPGDTGFLAAELIRPGGTLISSDFVPEMLSAAQRRAERLGLDNVRFRQIDLGAPLDLEAASIDGVLCRWGYMLLDDPESALRETRRVLKPGARVALAAWTGPDDNQWSVLGAKAMIDRGLAEPPAPGAPGQFAWAREGAIAETLEAAGFSEHHVETLSFPIAYRSADDWWTSRADLSPGFTAALEGASPDDVAAVRAAIETGLERFAADDGTLSFPARTWVAWAAA